MRIELSVMIAILATACVHEPPKPPPPPPAEPPMPVVRELIEDGGFEGAAPGPWHENNWARNHVEFARDNERPWQGAFSQRMRMLRIDGSPNLELVQPLKGLTPGDAILVRFALRGTANGRPVSANVRRWNKPYTFIASLKVPVTEDWQVSTLPVLIPANFDTSDVAFFIDLHDESTIWVDDVSIGLLPKADPRPIRPGNLVANGSFEVGTNGWVGVLRNAGGLDRCSAAQDRISPADWTVVEDPQAPDGRQVLRFVVHEDGMAFVNSRFFPYRHGHPLRLSLRLNAPSAGATARIALGRGDSPNTVGWLAEKSVTATAPGWQEVTLDCIPGPSASGAFVEVTTLIPGVWLLDAVHVEQAPGDAVASFGCTMPDAPPGRIFRGAEQPRLRVLAVDAAPGDIAATVRIEDVWDRTVATLPLTLAIGADGRGSAELDLPRDRFGGFRCAVETDERLLAEQLYAVVPDLPPPDGSGRSFFGGHFAFDPHSLDLAERAGFRWLRMMSTQLDSNWMAVQPEQDRWAIRTVAVERALARGFSVLGNLNSPPEWAALKTGEQPYAWWHSRLPRDWAEWTTYVQRTVKAFPGIRAWEVGNEMDCDYLIVPPDRDKPTAYADLVKRTRAAVEAVDPKATMVGIGVSNPDRPFWREAIAKGAAGDLDAIAFHFYYEDLDPLEKRPDFIAAMADMRAAKGRTGASPELWMGEGGMWLNRSPSRLHLLNIPPPGTTDLDAAHAIVRTAAAFKALGLKHSFHYAGGTSSAGNGNWIWRSECKGLFDYDGSARPALAAHAAMVWVLDNAEPRGAESVTVGAAQVRLARFLDPRRGRITVAWSRAPVPAKQVPGLLDGKREVLDMMGNPVDGAVTLTAAPVYIIATP
jgi:hypothetical protein